MKVTAFAVGKWRESHEGVQRLRRIPGQARRHAAAIFPGTNLDAARESPVAPGQIQMNFGMCGHQPVAILVHQSEMPTAVRGSIGGVLSSPASSTY
jgi:hypothetical protein